jgi:hypothetical protein
MNREELTALHDAIGVLLTWPDAVRDQIAAWLAPEAAKGAAKGNGVDPKPPMAATAPPSRQAKALARQNSPFNVQTRLIAALQSNVSLTERALANCASVARSTAAERLRQMASAGLVVKGGNGHWRLAEKAGPPARGAEADPPQAPSN